MNREELQRIIQEAAEARAAAAPSSIQGLPESPEPSRQNAILNPEILKR